MKEHCIQKYLTCGRKFLRDVKKVVHILQKKERKKTREVMKGKNTKLLNRAQKSAVLLSRQ
jgi:hypothetical protein